MSTKARPELPPVPRLVLVIVVSIAAFSLLNALLLIVLFDPPVATLPRRIIQIFVTCGLAYFLFRGAAWARWVAIVCCILAAVVCVNSVAGSGEPVPLFFVVWLVANAVVCGAVASLLLFSPSVVNHFTRRVVSPPRSPVT